MELPAYISREDFSYLLFIIQIVVPMSGRKSMISWRLAFRATSTIYVAISDEPPVSPDWKDFNIYPSFHEVGGEVWNIELQPWLACFHFLQRANQVGFLPTLLKILPIIWWKVEKIQRPGGEEQLQDFLEPDERCSFVVILL